MNFMTWSVIQMTELGCYTAPPPSSVTSVCLTQQLPHIAPQTGLWHQLKMSRHLTHSPIVSHPFGKQHDNYRGIQFCKLLR